MARGDSLTAGASRCAPFHARHTGVPTCLRDLLAGSAFTHRANPRSMTLGCSPGRRVRVPPVALPAMRRPREDHDLHHRSLTSQSDPLASELTHNRPGTPTLVPLLPSRSISASPRKPPFRCASISSHRRLPTTTSPRPLEVVLDGLRQMPVADRFHKPVYAAAFGAQDTRSTSACRTICAIRLPNALDPATV